MLLQWHMWLICKYVISMYCINLLLHTYHHLLHLVSALFTSLAYIKLLICNILTEGCFEWYEEHFGWTCCQCHLVNVCRWFPQCGQEWCASCRPRAANGIRQKPQTNLEQTQMNLLSKLVKHSNVKFSGMCVCLCRTPSWPEVHTCTRQPSQAGMWL